MGEVINICQYVLWDVTILLQTKLKDLEGHRFILRGKDENSLQKKKNMSKMNLPNNKTMIVRLHLAAVVFHQCCRHIHMVARA